MPVILAVTMQKGGVGKTTTTLNLAADLATKGKRVLAVDIDPQASLTEGLGVDPNSIEHTIYNVLLNTDYDPAYATLQTSTGVDLIPANIALASAEMQLSAAVGREMLLHEALAHVNDRYDYILIDPPPSLGLYTYNALAAATAAIVPVKATDVYGMKAIPHLEAAIKLIRKINPSLHIGGFLLTQADTRLNINRVIETQLRENYKEAVFKAVIPFNSKQAETPALGQPITVYAPTSAAAVAYQHFTEEVLARYGNE